MKKAALLFLCGIIALQSCHKDEAIEKDASLTGIEVDVSTFPKSVKKVFVLNEGGNGSNNSTLDLVRTSDGLFITGVFKKMNPDVATGLGDVGNDVAVHGNEVWIVVNNSGIVEVISAEDETEIAAIPVPTPRNIAFDKKYAYVSSWSGAYATGNYDDSFNYVISDYKNPKGNVYRINLKTKKVDGTLEVGFQPEGLALHDGRLYVANSGGIASQIPPAYQYDNTVSIIDTKSFKIEKTLEVAPNLKGVWSDGKGNIYVSSFGNFWDIHSALYMIDKDDTVKHVSDYVSVAAIDGDTMYCIGTEDEFAWDKAKVWKAWTCKGGVKSEWNFPVEATALYSFAALGNDTFLVGDAGDYFNPGSVSCWNGGTKLWSVTAGVCPGHFAVLR